ncbi:MAG TPA: ATP-binding protein [Steroidobacteraceae bacterium]|nr:ATP-binding protein [Steroidobacteraceae bacterium]
MSMEDSRLRSSDREREHLLARLLESLPVVVFRLDRELRHLYINNAVRDVLGWGPETLLGKRAAQAGFEPDVASGFEAICREVFATGEARRYDFSIESDHGARFLEAQLLPEFDAEGRLESLVGITTDWSERKQVQDDLQASEERYRALIAQVRNYAIFAVDLQGHATTWNEGVERVLGWSRKEFIGLPIENLFAPEDIARGLHRRELQRAAEDGSATGDQWLRRKDGSPFFATGMTSRVVDSRGHVVGFSKVLRDRTAWKLAQDERDKLLESERKARQEAEAANRLKDEFLATLSHELRSPLNAIVGWVHVLRRHAEASPDVARGLEVIERNARAQTQIVNDLLDMSRIMTGKVRLNPRLTSLQKIVSAALEAIRPAAEGKGIRLAAQLDPATDRIRGDPNRLQQVLWNLLTNAVKFTPGGGSVRIASRRDESHVELSVQDSGVGIPGAFLPFVFDRFRQADASTTRTFGGLGLGLSIVKNLVELHGGTVRGTSPGEGQGSTFFVRLPLPPHDAAEGPTGRVALLAPSPLESLPKLTDVAALVVDDEADSLVFCGRLLEECGARVMLAVDAQQALDILRTEPVDILVSDIGMAHEDGYYLVAQLRALADSRTARIPAIAVTAYARPEDRQRLLLAGYQMHIGKPIEPQELIAGIASLVGVTGRQEHPGSVPRDASGSAPDAA